MTATIATTAAPIGLYEHLKDDLGYLKLTRAAEILPGLLDRARTEQLTHAQFLAEPGRGSGGHPQPQARGPAAVRPFPGPAHPC